eukprot:15332657-Ditylum_brightwellii.AAC.1
MGISTVHCNIYYIYKDPAAKEGSTNIRDIFQGMGGYESVFLANLAVPYLAEMIHVYFARSTICEMYRNNELDVLKGANIMGKASPTVSQAHFL